MCVVNICNCIVCIREASASVFMYLLVKQRGLCVIIDKQDYPRILLLGVFSFVNVVGTVLALQYISAVQYSGACFSCNMIVWLTYMVVNLSTLNDFWQYLSLIFISSCLHYPILSHAACDSGRGHNHQRCGGF